MRRLFVIPVLVTALLAAASLAPAALNDVNGPACADITDVDWGYSADGTTAEVHMFVAAASCRQVTYTLVAQNSATDSTVVATGTASGDGSAFFPDGTDVVTVDAAIPAAGQDGVICLYTTTSVGTHVFDRAPDTGCVELIPGGSAGTGGYN